MSTLRDLTTELETLEIGDDDNPAQVRAKIQATIAKYATRRVIVKAFANGLGRVQYRDDAGEVLYETWEPIDPHETCN